MSEKVRVAIRVHDGVPVVSEKRISDKVTCVPGEVYEVEMTYAVKTALATGDFVEVKDDEAPQPRAPAEEPETAHPSADDVSQFLR